MAIIVGKLATELAALWRKEPHSKRGKGRKHRMFIAEWMLKKMGWPPEWFNEGDW